MNQVVSALLPIFIIILLGSAAKRTEFLNSSFWEQADRAIYYVLFPALLIPKLSAADMSAVDLGQFGIVILCWISTASVVAFIFSHFIAKTSAGATSVFQGGIRFNAYVGLAMSEALFGSDGLVMSAVIMSLMIPLINFCCVLVFSVLTSKSGSIKGVFIAVSKNPLILSCLLGLGLNQTGIGFPAALEPIIKFLSSMALPLGLLSVGAGLNFKVLIKSSGELFWSSLYKLCLMPLFALGFCAFFALNSLSTSVVLLFATLPTATSSYILARQLGGDAPMMSAIITGQTLLSMISMPLMLILFNIK